MYQSPEPVVRLTRPSDNNALADLDLKCYDYPYSNERWKELAGESGKKKKPRVVVLEVLRKPAGYAVWNYLDEDTAKIIRLGVKPGWRRKGLGSVLLGKIIHHSQIEKADKLQVIIPDIHCIKGDPDNVSGFLAKTNFTATGEVIEGYRYMYGEWRDGYVFERNIVHDQGLM
jgi:GNAT superfamily N-acetyltransferase